MECICMLIAGLGSILEEEEYCSHVRQLKELPKHIQEAYISLKWYLKEAAYVFEAASWQTMLLMTMLPQAVLAVPDFWHMPGQQFVELHNGQDQGIYPGDEKI